MEPNRQVWIIPSTPWHIWDLCTSHCQLWGLQASGCIITGLGYAGRVHSRLHLSIIWEVYKDWQPDLDSRDIVSTCLKREHVQQFLLLLLFFLQNLGAVNEVAQLVRVPDAKSEDMSFIPGSHMVERKNPLLWIILRPSHTSIMIYTAPSPTHAHTKISKLKCNKICF